MDLAAGLDRALRRAGIPIEGIRIVTAADRGTWTVLYAANATAQQRTDGAAIVASYDPATDTAGATEDAEAQFDRDKMLKALGIWTAQKLSIPLATARAQILVIYRSL